MSRLSCPVDAVAPFAQQTMQEVMDRLGPTSSGNNFVASHHILRAGVFVTAATNKKSDSHHKMMETKMFAVADKRGQKSLMSHLSFERSIQPNGGELKWLPR